MPEQHDDLIAAFKANAEKVGTTVVTCRNLHEAADYACGLCRQKGKVFAAPDLPDGVFIPLLARAEAEGLKAVRGNLRLCLNDIAVAITQGGMGIADTGSVIMASAQEDARLASMLADIHVIALPKSKIAPDSYGAEAFLRDALAGAMYVTFISGCSRTSDIERVLTLGVHGPLALHIALLEEA